MPPTEKTKIEVDSSPDNKATLQDAQKAVQGLVNTIKQKRPEITIPTVNAENVGTPKINIPTTKQEKPRITALDTVGTTPVPKTSQDIARETILSQVPEEDRDTIEQILNISTGFQTPDGKKFEDTAKSLMEQQLSNVQSIRDRKLDTSKIEKEFDTVSMRAELESIREEADVLKAAKQNAIQQAMAQEGTTVGTRSGDVQRITRDFDLQMGNLAVRELAAVGKMNAASRMIENMMDIKYGDLEAETELLTAQINAITPFLNREDQKAAETRLQLNEIVKNKIADAREADKALEEFKLQSYLFAQQNGATPATLSQIMSSTSREDVASVGGTMIQDPMTKLALERGRKEISQIGVPKGSTSSGSVIESVANAAVLGTPDDPILAMMSASAGGRALTQSEVEPLTNARRVTSQLDAIISSDIADNTGPIMGIIRSKNPFDVKAQELKASITALVPQLARGIYGEVGVLTDSDVERYIQTLPNLKSTDDVNKAVMGLTLRNVRNAFASQLESMAAAGRDVSGFVSTYSDMNNKINSIESSLGIGSQNSMTDEGLESEFNSFTSQDNDETPGFWKSIGNFFFGK